MHPIQPQILAVAPAVAGGGTLTLAAPPASLLGQALAGPHLLFLVADGAPQGPTYSEGAWLTLK